MNRLIDQWIGLTMWLFPESGYCLFWTPDCFPRSTYYNLIITCMALFLFFSVIQFRRRLVFLFIVQSLKPHRLSKLYNNEQMKVKESSFYLNVK